MVCEWIGNSEAVARKHYLQVTDEHFKAAKNAAHNTTLPVGTERQGSEQNCEFPEENNDCRELVVSGIAEEGLEPPTRGL